MAGAHHEGDGNEQGRVTVEVLDGVGLITFDNASRRNAIDSGMWDALEHGIERLGGDGSVRLVVLTGGGHLAFATDPATTAEGEGDDDTSQQERVAKICASIRALDVPVVARIRGECIGLGLVVAMAADLRVAAVDSGFALPAIQLGRGYDDAAVATLVSLVGPGQAARLLLTGARIEADEAARIGLVTHLVDDTDLSGAVADLAGQIVGYPGEAIKAVKRAIVRAIGAGQTVTSG